MGEVYADITVYGPNGQKRLHALVDTGATLTKFPKEVADELGLEIEGQAEVELSNGSTVIRPLVAARIELLGRKGTMTVSLSINGEEPLIGVTTLELLGFKVNPVTRKLEPTRHIEYS